MVSQWILYVNRVQLNSLPFFGTLPYLLNTLQGIFMVLNTGKASGTNTNYYFFLRQKLIINCKLCYLQELSLHEM